MTIPTPKRKNTIRRLGFRQLHPTYKKMAKVSISETGFFKNPVSGPQLYYQQIGLLYLLNRNSHGKFTSFAQFRLAI